MNNFLSTKVWALDETVSVVKKEFASLDYRLSKMGESLKENAKKYDERLEQLKQELKRSKDMMDGYEPAHTGGSDTSSWKIPYQFSSRQLTP